MVCKDNWTCLMLACKHQPTVVPNILNSQYCSKELLHMVTKYNSTCLTLACQYQPSIVLDILNSQYCSKELLHMVDKDNYTCLMVACQCQPSIVLDILNSQYCSKELLHMVCKDNWTYLMVACKHQPSIVLDILNSQYCSKELLHMVTKYNWTCLMIACDHQPSIVLDILNSQYCSKELLQVQITDIYTDKIPSNITSYISEEDIKKAGHTFLHILAIFNPDKLTYELLSTIDVSILEIRDNANNHFLDYLLNGNEPVILELQKNFTQYTTGVTLNKWYNQLTEHITRIKNTYNKDVTKGFLYNDPEYCKGIPNTECGICWNNELNTVINPCGHMICYTCSVIGKLSKCPICTTSIQSTTKIYM
jgi:ankyrin repeat protein